uniref:BAHD acyltransferase DCR n=1 Tax=Oryza nivara TaxID=4536 RepID=A0A0E0IFW0_ORYNI
MAAVDNAPPSPVVTVTSTRTVAPAAAKCVLATFDLPYITFYYNQKLLLYRLPNGASDFPDAVARMSASLSDALAYFYPLAGRIRQDDHDGSLSIHGQHGAEVIEASADHVSVDQLAGEECSEEAEKVMQLLVPYTGVMNLEGLNRPLLAVQLTRLRDGVAVGCAFNHAVLDGTSTWHFMTSWAELCRVGGAPSLLPVHNRGMARSVRVNLPLPASAEAHEKTDPNGPKVPLVARVFSFPPSAVARAKAAANAALPPGAKPFSSFQSLAAHIWRAVSRARALGPSDITVFAVFADCRARLSPPLPPAYFGNLIQAVFTGVPAGMLLAGPPELAAGLLQKAIDDHDAAAITRRLEEYEAAPKLFHYSDAGPNCVAVGSSPRFRVYDVDFGFGRPERVRSGANNKFDGMVYLYPGRGGDGGIDVELSLQPEPMQRLDKDQDFLQMRAP